MLNKSASTRRQDNPPIIHRFVTHMAAHLPSQLQHTNARNTASLQGRLLQAQCMDMSSMLPSHSETG